MSDKNNIAAEDYLDSLLRSIVGGDEETSSSASTTEKGNDEELFGFEEALGAQGSDDDFLSDFEKEFFDEEESKMMVDLMNEVKQTEAMMTSEPAQDNPENLMSFDNLDLDSFMFDEPEADNVKAVTPEVEAMPVETNVMEPSVAATQEDIPQFDEPSEAVSPELLFEGFEEFDDIDDMGAGVALVDEAVDKGDSDVEDDLKGLYGILGVDGESEELPEDIAVPRKRKKKKKGFFEGLFGKKKKAKVPGTSMYEIVDDEESSGEAQASMDGMFDAGNGATSADADFNDDDMDLSAAFDMLGGMPDDNGAGAASGDKDFDEFDDAFDFGLDDSAFDSLGGGAESENDTLMRQMNDSGASSFFDEDDEDDENGESNGKKGKKGKKDKKAKGSKKANAKKAKPKKAKAQKEKRPKEPDEIIDVPKIYFLFLITFVVVASLGATWGGDYYNYQQNVYEAVKLYVDTDQTDMDKYESRYSEAYSLLSGIKMRDKDHKVFFNQVETIMFMDIHYESYKNYMLLGDYEHGLDSLIKAVKMYDKYQNAARDLECFDDMTIVLGWVDEKLNNVYGISSSYAREIYMISDDTEYATIVRKIAAEARKNASNKVEIEDNEADKTEGTEGK